MSTRSPRRCRGNGETRRRLVLLTVLAVAGLAGTVFAQVSPEEHAKHHPQSDQSDQPGVGPGGPGAGPGGPGGPGMGGMMEGMGGMMESMHSSPQNELYPALMQLGDLPLEQRAAVNARAHERMQSGAARLSGGLERLSQAAPGDNFAEMQSALGEMRAGLAEFDSGLAGHRALAEGQSPKSVALQWFKREMNLLDQAPPQGAVGPFGLSWFHFFTMTLLTVFAAVMIGMYFLKMRRATALLRSLTAGADAGASPGAATSAKPTAEPGSRPAAIATPAAAPAAPAAAPAPAPAAAAAAVTPTPLPRTTAAVPDGPWRGELQVVSILDETPEIKSFRLMHPSGAPIPFTFLPGQFLTLTATLDGKPVKRSYTIASSPTLADYVEISVKREAQGKVSRFLHDVVQEGDSLDVRAPLGTFTFVGTESESIVLIGGGVGITPLMSVIRYLTDRAWPGEITLLYCCRTSADFTFREELEYRQKRHPNLNVIATMTREAGTVWMGSKGRLTRELIAGSVDDVARQRVHVCGPQPMMDAVAGMLSELGTPDANIKTEAFGPAKKPAAPAAGAPVQAAPAAAAPAPAAPSAAEIPAATGVQATVTFTRSDKSAPLPAETFILDVADQVGVDIDNSCREGTCGSCMVKLLSGQVTMETEDGLDPADKQAGFVLACQAVSSGDVSVDA